MNDRALAGGMRHGVHIRIDNAAAGRELLMSAGAATKVWQNSYLRVEAGVGKVGTDVSSATLTHTHFNGGVAYTGGSGAFELPTEANPDVVAGGFFFSISTTEGVTLHSIDVIADGDGFATFDLWMTQGDYAGATSNLWNWHLVGSDFKVSPQGKGRYTRLTFPEVNIPSGTYSFYVSMASFDGSDHRMWGEAGTATFNEHGSIQVDFGESRAGNHWCDSLGLARTMAGRFHYTSWTVPAPILAVTGLTAGATGTMSVSQATPSSSVLPVWSAKGPGPQDSVWGQAFVARPFKRMPAITTDALGTGSIGVPAPAGSTGLPVWFHALDLGLQEFSNPVVVIIQ